MKKRVAVLGATGSIGKNTLDVIRGFSDGRFEPVLFSTNSNVEELRALKKEFPQAITALAAENISPMEGIDFFGRQGLLSSIAEAKADIVVNAISGAAGLLPSKAALEASSDLALANKETVVIAGSRIFALAEEKKRRIIPVDSEHSAIFKLIHAHGSENIDEIILTASGGAFRNFTHQMLKGVTPEQAMRHPTWSMGRKITVDSATLANKGLEVIEAARFFGFPPERIKVVIHPQSIVHSMVRLKNGAVYAQMSFPDMRLPILDALCWPETSFQPLGSLDFDSLTLTFEKCDMQKFPMIDLAYRALAEGELMPAVYNAANEAAVEAFLNKRIGFLEISSVVRYVIDSIRPTGEMSIDNALKWDKASREAAESFIKQTGNSLNGSASC